MVFNRASQILGPLLRTNEFLGVGPFERPFTEPGQRETLDRYLRYNKIAKFMVKFWWFRGLGLFTMKYFFARSYFRAGVSDFGRNTVTAIGLLHVSSNLKRLNEAIAILDKFPHREDSDRWLTRVVSRMNICIWMYVALRFLLDVATFVNEDLMPVYVESELFMDPSRIPASARPLLLVYISVDLFLNRLITSTGLMLNICTYIAFNFLTFIKFRKFNGDVQHCLRNRGSPEDIWKLRLVHADLCQLVLFMDDIYAPLAIFFHGGVVSGYCTETLRFIQHYEKGIDMSKSALTLFAFMVNMTYLVTMLSLVTASTSKICESPRKSMHIVSELLQDNSIADMSAGIQQIRLLLSQMNVKSVQMTAWHFYKLDRGALMTTLGASVSYMSLVVQSSRAE